MGRWTWRRLPIAVGSGLVAGAIGWSIWAYRLPPSERSDALTLLGIALSLIGVLPLLASLIRRPAGRRPADKMADLLAQAVSGQWRKAATERRLLIPDPIPIRWSLYDLNLNVAGPVAAAVGMPGVPPPFPPLPGQAAITEEDLRVGGGRRELHGVYAGLASRRIVVVGQPGSGKSGTAILLLLDALEHRDRLEDPERARVPVPVLFTAHGWDPTTCSVQDWVHDRLVATYPLFQCRSGAAEATAMVMARDKVALILDGLDEMDADLRPAALQALSDAPFPVVVLSRDQEMVRATSGGWLVGAVAVHLHDVTATEAADYLQRALPGPPPSGWPGMLTQLRAHPKGLLARALSIPLTLTLIRDTYQAGDDISELLDPSRYTSTDAVQQHLIARVLPAAYHHRPGRPPPRYTEQQARQTLTFIATMMGKDRDLAWWRIPRWAPTTPHIVVTGLAGGLVGALVNGVEVETVGALVNGVEGDLVSGLVFGFVFGLAGGFTGGFTGGLTGGRRGGEPRRVRIANRRVAISRQVLQSGLIQGLKAGLAGGLAVGLVGVILGQLTLGLAYGFYFGLVFVLAVGLIGGFLEVLVEDGAAEGNPVGPHETWRNDRMVGLTNGLAVVLLGGLTVGLGYGFQWGLTSGLVFVLAFGLAFGLTSSATWVTTMVWFQLRRSGQAPAVGLMPFLEDARERGILRSVGAVYQFRHAMLQDHLTAQTTENAHRRLRDGASSGPVPEGRR